MSTKSNGIPTRLLGSTGVKVTILGVGGYHVGRSAVGKPGVGRPGAGKTGSPELAIRIIRTAIDAGINFMDNAWCYNKGESERIMGHALRDGYRDKVFLMTKNHGRDRATFEAQLEESLRRLQTDRIDLLQFHEIVDEGVPQRIFSEGAIEAAVQAREAGKIRFIGFTGHRWPHLLAEMLDQDFAWDTVQFPANLLDAQYRSFTKQILPVLKARGIGTIGMKSLAADRILQAGVSPQEAISYSLTLPIDVLVSGIDSMAVLQQNLEIVRNWQPLTDEEQTALLERVAPFAGDGHLERYKTG